MKQTVMTDFTDESEIGRFLTLWFYLAPAKFVFLSKIEKWPWFFERPTIFANWAEYLANKPKGSAGRKGGGRVWSQISTKSLCLALCFLPKIEKFKMAAIFRKTYFFLENILGTVSCWDALGVKDWQNSSISLQGDTGNFGFLPKIKKFKMAAIFERKKSFWKWGNLAKKSWAGQKFWRNHSSRTVEDCRQYCVFAFESLTQNS